MISVIQSCCYAITICIFAHPILSVENDYFTSIAGMQTLLILEEHIVDCLNNYISEIQKKFAQLQKDLNEINQHRANNPNDYQKINETLHRFLVSKRLAKDWDHISQNVGNNQIRKDYFGDIRFFTEYNPMPGDVDLRGAALGLARVQETYKLNTTDLINGKIKNHQTKTEMSVSDISELGLQLVDSKYGVYSILWLTEALNQLDVNETDNSLKIEILNKLAISYENEGHYPMALESVEKIIALTPDDIPLTRKRSHLFIEALKAGNDSVFEKNQNIHKYLEGLAIEIEQPILHTDMRHTSQYQVKVYEAVCRGDAQPSAKELSELHCKYVINKSPFLKIAPLKLEEVSIDPYIVVYHDAMYDAEIELIKSYAQPKLRRAGVEGYDGEKSFVQYTDHRIGQVAWFKDTKHKYFEDISQRVADMTGLSMELSEQLQVVNYGIAGQYDMHFDFALEDDLTYEDDGTGNRIATVLFYVRLTNKMTDVEAGGATAFPLIKRAVFPKKGTAVFWLNLFASGVGDLRTKHAGCPVLVGSKWVANKWLHLYDQQFSRPCELHPDHEE